MQLRYSIIAVLFLSLFSGCIKKNARPIPETPEELVKEFIRVSADSHQVADRKRIQDLCTGELRRTFERMNDEAFRLIYVDTKVKIEDFKILSSQNQGETAKIQYQITIDNASGTDVTKEVNSREVELVKKDGHWFVESIRTLGKDQVAFTKGMLF